MNAVESVIEAIKRDMPRPQNAFYMGVSMEELDKDCLIRIICAAEKSGSRYLTHKQ